jgi:hypothetical protein
MAAVVPGLRRKEDTMARRRGAYDVADRDAVVDDAEVVRPRPLWSPAQIIGLVIGLLYLIGGIAAMASTGFNTSHIYTPHKVVFHVAHSPLLALCEIVFGALLIIASVVPGAARSVMALLGAIAVAFGLIILLDVAESHVHHWFGVTDRNGWIYVITGAILVLSAFFMPMFGGTTRRRVRTASGPRRVDDRAYDEPV